MTLEELPEARFAQYGEAIQEVWRQGDVPPLASLLHARWWQLETWLRGLAYVELRAKYGLQWVDRLPQRAADYERNDSGLSYMASTDGGIRIAYLDVGPLLKLINDNEWDLFECSLINQTVWRARVIELQKIRRQIAHCRRPHADDLSRLEQTLRDLERGAFNALSSYNRQFHPSPGRVDPLVQAWIDAAHPDAHLVEHASRNKEIYFDLTYSRRPWADPLNSGEPISGREGYLWHASFYMRHSFLRLERWWQEYIESQPAVRDQIVLVTCDSMDSVSISFAAVDDPSVTSNVIGYLFEGILASQKYDRGGENIDWGDAEAKRLAGQMDPRVQIKSLWSVVDDTTTPITIFSA